MKRHFLISCAAVMLLTSCGEEHYPVWRVPLSEDDAFSLALVILGEGKVAGCGDVEVVEQSPISRQITVSCKGGDKPVKHELRYYPYLNVDGRDTDTDPLTRRGLSDAYCVKAPDGKWDVAYLDLGKAHDRAEQLSTKADKPARIYAIGEAKDVFWEAVKRPDGSWYVGAPLDKVQDIAEKEGCELGNT